MKLLFEVYAAVLAAELLGDKTLYSVSMLMGRYRTALVFCGLIPAFMAKMAVAVLLGGFVAGLNPAYIRGLSAATFLTMAAVIAFAPKETASTQAAAQPTRQWSAVLAAFAAVFFSEWGDVGQIAAATMTARTKLPLMVWTAATLALVTKAIAAATLGVGVKKLVPERVLRRVSAAIFVVLGVLAGVGVD